jgi:long-chain acyl-CoA synthetase
VSGGAALGDRLSHFFRGAGITIVEGYGLTETTAASTVNRPSRNKIGTVGQPLPGVSVRIAEDGEILLSGHNRFVGYWHNDGATSEALTPDGWLRTGDIGDLDDEGYLRVTGRKKELIVTAGGKNVSPAVLEDRIRAHPLVSQCLVVGDGRPYVACLITLDPEAVRTWLARRNRPADTSLSQPGRRSGPDRRAPDRGRRRQQGRIQGRIHQAVPRARHRLHRGGRIPDAIAQAPPQRGHEGFRG